MSFVASGYLPSPLKKAKIEEEKLISVASEDISPPSDKSSSSSAKSTVIDDSSYSSSSDNDDDDFADEPDPFDIDVVEPVMGYEGPNVYRCNPEDDRDMIIRDDCLLHVIAEYNNRVMKTKSQLQLIRILNATRLRSYHYNYFITFEAFDTVSRRSDTYQAEVFCTHQNDDKDILQFRRKGENRELLLPVDLSDHKDFDRINKSAHAVIDFFNKFEFANSPLKLLKILKAVGDLKVCRNFLISFVAKDTVSDEVNTYFAEVNYVLSDDTIGVCFLTLKDEVKDGDFFAALLGDE